MILQGVECLLARKAPLVVGYEEVRERHLTSTLLLVRLRIYRFSASGKVRAMDETRTRCSGFGTAPHWKTLTLSGAGWRTGEMNCRATGLPMTIPGELIRIRRKPGIYRP